MNEDFNNPNPLSGGADVPSSDGTGSESKVVGIKDVLAQTLGKEFPTDEAALKAVKDTFSYVGKRKEQIAAEMKQESNVDTSKFISREEFEELNFFKENPEVAPFKAFVNAVKKETGKSYAEVLNSDEVKGVLEKVKAYNEFEKSKSVLSSNPRLGQVTDKMSKAREAAKSAPSVAGQFVAEAVIDAFEL